MAFQPDRSPGHGRAVVKLEKVVCDLCETDENTPFFVDNGYQLVRCKNCDLVYVNPRPSAADLGRFYDSFITESPAAGHTGQILTADTYDQGEAGHRRRAEKVWNQVRRLSARGPLLDIGCGTGFLLELAKREGWEVAGIEISRPMAERARRRVGQTVYTEELEAATFPAESFQVVTLLDVICHLRSPRSTFREIHRLLRPDGMVVVQAGDEGSLRRKEDGELLWMEWGTPQHLFHFSEDTLRHLFHHTGFEAQLVRSSHKLNDLLAPEYLMQRGRSRIRYAMKQAIRYVPGARMAAMGVLRALTAGRPCLGRNLLFVARKASVSSAVSQESGWGARGVR